MTGVVGDAVSGAMTFGQRLAEWRRRAGYTSAAKAAHAAGVSRSLWSQYENDTPPVTGESVVKMARAVHWPPKDALLVAGLDPDEHLPALGGTDVAARTRLMDKLERLPRRQVDALEVVVDAMAGTDTPEITIVSRKQPALADDTFARGERPSGEDVGETEARGRG